MLTSSCLATAQKTPTPEDKYGDGRVSEFYTWKSAIPEQAGKLLKTEAIHNPYIRLANDSQAIRILYSSTSGKDSKTPIVVSGSIHFEPYRVCRRVNILRDYPDDKTKLYPRN
ncbi:hypothetical protein EA722_15500 [Acinetobacter baumannii]|uniref:Uncharacterized protein n=1 Tax=Acinetobacter baumannii TaxID=470 RepID=A0A3R9SYA4_ACIBA|nr:hypothetical protein EA722_15500 [Acinetobacter baumannii]